MTASALGDFLRARRAETRPDDVGLPTYGSRRVPGLRREEVAMLAGMSVDYYVRLEQGRERSPSAQLLTSLCRALRLDRDGREHLFRLAGLAPGDEAAPLPERVDASLLTLMEGWPDHPAVVLGRAYDVLAANRLGQALFEGFETMPNLLLMVFADPSARHFYRDWDLVAANTVAGFRVLHGRYPHDQRIAAVLARATETSGEFGRLWRRHEARGKRLEVKHLRHREVGDLTLRMHSFDVRSSPGQELVVYHAEPGSPSEGALALLGTVAATRDRDAAPRD
ncbi:helix-turn-helix domain-containing protein [Phycicoccus sp. CSK15P-2]|uniref:helix-turn-helix transcriptional regulator n=1 Tax=Phycicoccus sp. CSK15P-2 TaxID=2807627 RepID=UPI00194F05B8|nr:helix-turn-helix transcriptional regulator [Phycicoccus sp. CSK15P-2]MBM6404017.1 helix-turn-helix domain-containing protein [Phycicoccus sp. CSK15P-2]